MFNCGTNYIFIIFIKKNNFSEKKLNPHSNKCKFRETFKLLFSFLITSEFLVELDLH